MCERCLGLLSSIGAPALDTTINIGGTPVPEYIPMVPGYSRILVTFLENSVNLFCRGEGDILMYYVGTRPFRTLWNENNLQ